MEQTFTRKNYNKKTTNYTYFNEWDFTRSQFNRRFRTKKSIICLNYFPNWQWSYFQIKRCACLLNITLNKLSVSSACRNELSNKCLNDRKAFCALEDTNIFTQHFAVYKKGIYVQPFVEVQFVVKLVLDITC